MLLIFCIPSTRSYGVQMESRKIDYYEQITNALIHIFLASISCWFRASNTSSFNPDSYISSEGLRRCQTGGDVSQPKSLSSAIFGPHFGRRDSHHRAGLLVPHAFSPSVYRSSRALKNRKSSRGHNGLADRISYPRADRKS